MSVEISERITRWRENARLSKAELARKCEVTGEAVSQWESGRTTPTTRSIERIAEACGVSVSVFWGEVPARRAS